MNALTGREAYTISFMRQMINSSTESKNKVLKFLKNRIRPRIYKICLDILNRKDKGR